MTITNTLKHALSTVALLALCVFALGSIDAGPTEQAVLEQDPSLRISANELYGEYDRNEVAADTKYEGKVIAVTGVIQDIGKDVLDDVYIVIGGAGFLDGVQCTFMDSQASVVGDLSKGQSVTVKGVVDGKLGNVLINKCSLL